MSRLALTAENLEALLDDLDRAVDELAEPFRRDDAGWARGPAGKWSAGQHLEHVARMLGIGAEALERGAEELRRHPRRRPWRDPLQAWLIGMLTAERFPKGGKAPARGSPSPVPDRQRTLAELARQATRYRELRSRLSEDERRGLWTWNPFAPSWLRWHYTLPELTRVQASHARHHARLSAEAASAAARPSEA